MKADVHHQAVLLVGMLEGAVQLDNEARHGNAVTALLMIALERAKELEATLDAVGMQPTEG